MSFETSTPLTAADVWTPPPLDEPTVVMLAELASLALRPGDRIELVGDLGAGKSTFARALIRSVIGDDTADVPSPTFSLVQTYQTPRLTITHADLYRLQSPFEADELALDEAVASGAVLIEWADRLGGAEPGAALLRVRFGEVEDLSVRVLSFSASGAFLPRLDRVRAKWDFLNRNCPETVPLRVRFMQGDASARGYARLEGGGETRILMDAPRQADGPPVRDGLPYSRIAHLAEDVRAFVAIADHLSAAGHTVPNVIAHDLDHGLLLLRDLGDGVYARLVAAGADQAPLWRQAVDTLVDLRALQTGLSLPLPDGTHHVLSRYDAAALAIEVELLIDWLWPALHGRDAPAEVRASFRAAWMPVLRRLASMSDGLVLRDFHSPNLIRVADGRGGFRVGLIDFQDAVLGPAAYDLASLLFDARVDVPAELERDLYEHYIARVASSGRPFDRAGFDFAYAALAAQRTTKILGIFARLSRRDGKHVYLSHLPRLWRYLERGLAHPDLAMLEVWFDRHWPAETRVELPPP
jgi:hypothetical protein